MLYVLALGVHMYMQLNHRNPMVPLVFSYAKSQPDFKTLGVFPYFEGALGSVAPVLQCFF